MKKLLAGLIFTTLLFITGCSIGVTGKPPEFSVSNPYAIPDGSGGVIVSYQINNGNDIRTYVQRLGAQGYALWGKRGIELGSGSGGFSGHGEGEFAPLVSDGRGNVIVVYSLKDALWAQKLDMEGLSVWSASRVQVSRSSIPMPVYFKAVGDNSGGVITAWASGDNRLCLQRTDNDGNQKWYTEVSTSELDRFDIASDANGNAFIIWKDNPSYSEGDIFVLKVDAGGRVAWPNGGLQFTNTENPGYVRGGFNQRIISDGDGGALAIWVQAVLSDDGRKITRQDLYTQRINNDGETLWEPEGVLVAKMAQEPRLIGDTLDSMLVFWEDLRAVYAQRLDATGSTTWPEAGITVGQAGEPHNIMYYYSAGDGADGAVVVWNYTENGNKFLRAQRLDAGGMKLWGANGIKMSSVPPYWADYSTPARVSPDGSGGFIVSLAAGEHIKDKTSSYVQRISAEGDILWGEEGIRLNP